MTTRMAEAHKKAISTPARGIMLKPNVKWNVDPDYPGLITFRLRKESSYKEEFAEYCSTFSDRSRTDC